MEWRLDLREFEGGFQGISGWILWNLRLDLWKSESQL